MVSVPPERPARAHVWDVLPESLDCGFAVISRCLDSSGLGELRICSRNVSLVEEGLTQLMDYMDQYLEQPDAQKGFCITYDLRALRAPSMSMVMRIAEWGKHPYRQQTWQKLNRMCKVVVPSGMWFTMAKKGLSTFFYMCPPVCDTYLLWDLDQPKTEGAYFAPPPEVKAAEAELRAAQEAEPTPEAAPEAVSASPSPSPAAASSQESPVVETRAAWLSSPFLKGLMVVAGDSALSQGLVGVPQAAHWSSGSISAVA